MDPMGRNPQHSVTWTFSCLVNVGDPGPSKGCLSKQSTGNWTGTDGKAANAQIPGHWQGRNRRAMKRTEGCNPPKTCQRMVNWWISQVWGWLLNQPIWEYGSRVVFLFHGSTQLMVNWCFGARWFGFRKDPRKWKGLLLRGIPRIPNHRAPNQQLTTSWVRQFTHFCLKQTILPETRPKRWASFVLGNGNFSGASEALHWKHHFCRWKHDRNGKILI